MKNPKTLNLNVIEIFEAERQGTQTMKNHYPLKLFNLWTNPFKYNGLKPY